MAHYAAAVPRGWPHREPSPTAALLAASGPDAFPVHDSVGRLTPTSATHATADRWDFSLPYHRLQDRPPPLSPGDGHTPKARPGPPAAPAPADSLGLSAADSVPEAGAGVVGDAQRWPSAGSPTDYARPPRMPLTDSARPRPQPLDSTTALAAELDQLELQEQAVWQRLGERAGQLAVELAAVDDRQEPRWAALGEELAEKAEHLRAEQLSQLLHSPDVMDAYWRERFRIQEQQWQAKVAQLQSQLDVARRRGLSPAAKGRQPLPSGTPQRSPSPRLYPGATPETDVGVSPRSDVSVGSNRLGLDVIENDGRGVLVTQARGPAQVAGLRMGDVVKSIRCSSATPNVAAFRQAAAAIRPATRVQFVIEREGEERRLALTT